MNDQMLEQVAKMLRAQLKGAGHLWWIGGWVNGVTSNGDPFIILYPADEKLNEKVVRVYPHDFGKLPRFIPTGDLDGGDTEANPNKEQARKKGIYHECPVFEIVTYDGKETQMGRERRFGDVLRLSRAAREAVQSVGAPTPAARPQPQPRPLPVATNGDPALPDYRALAVAADNGERFDYAAFMALRGAAYDSVDRITRTRGNLAPDWHPSPAMNEALLVALEVYREERLAAEERGESPAAAHAHARQEALRGYEAVLS